MRVDFFHASCQEPPVREELFGICDDRSGGKAYTTLHAPDLWAAAVSNPARYPVVFTAIDKCVLQDHELPGRGRCDGMLTTEKHLYLVELKNQAPPWQRHAVQQLESTIDLLRQHHNLDAYRLKKAFACNRKRPRFAVLDNDENLDFFRRTGFRLDIQAEIVLL